LHDPPPNLFQILIGLCAIADKKICKIQIADTCIPAITIFFAIFSKFQWLIKYSKIDEL
jgi:hypothetical protein